MRLGGRVAPSAPQDVVGATPGSDCALAAQPLDLSRLTFSGSPCFDPTPLYDETTRQAFGDPAVLREGVDDRDPPLAHV